MSKSFDLLTLSEGEEWDVSPEILKWSDTDETWDLYEMDAHFNFLGDVLEGCYSIYIEDIEYEAAFPSGGGHLLKVTTSKPEEARKEIRSGLAKLMWSNRGIIMSNLDQSEETFAAMRKRRMTKRLVNGSHIGTVYEWDGNFLPDAVELWLEREPEKSPKYRLWTRANGYWDPAGFTLEAADSDREAASNLVQRIASSGGFLSTSDGGDLLSGDEMSSLMDGVK
jgi:hypothetical protein